MIKLNETWGISSNVTVAEFGNGDIIVADAYIEDGNIGCLMLANDVPNPIGKEHPLNVGKTTDDLKQDIIMTFTDTASIDVIIGALQKAKDKMNDEHEKESLTIFDNND